MLSIDDINRLEKENANFFNFLRSILKIVDSQKMIEEVKLKAIKHKIERYFDEAQKGVK